MQPDPGSVMDFEARWSSPKRFCVRLNVVSLFERVYREAVWHKSAVWWIDARNSGIRGVSQCHSGKPTFRKLLGA